MSFFCDKNVEEVENGEKTTLSKKSIEKLFVKVDGDKNGTISYRELSTFLKHQDSCLSEKAIDEIYKKADEDGDKQLTKTEFENLVNQNIFRKYVDRYFSLIMPRKYSDLYVYWPPPIFMILITIVEITLFCIDAHNGYTSANGPIAEHTIYDPAKRLQLWRYISYMLAHIGYQHLIMNLIVQICFGMTLEMANGSWRVALIYFAGVLGGSLGTSVLSPTVKLAGASGGVYSLVTGHVAIIILNWHDMDYPLTNLLFFFGFTIANIEHIPAEKKMNTVSHTTHFCGAIAGLLVGITILRNVKVNRCERTIQRIAFILYIVLMNVCIMWNIAAYNCQNN